MKTIKTSELTGTTLDWAVAKCEKTLPASFDDWRQRWPHYSTDWAQGGSIIDREKFTRIVTNISGGYTVSKKLVTLTDDGEEVHWVHGVGQTTLLAIMRCYVESKLGDTVEVPSELFNHV